MPFITSVEGTFGYGRPPPPSGGGSGPSGTMRVNVIGDANIATVITGLNTARTALGYSNVTMTYTNTPMTNYNGSNLTSANFDAAFVYTNGGITYNASFGTNLNAFITAGGPVVFGVFTWGNPAAITNFTYANSPYAFRGTQSSQTATMTKTVASPITANISTTVAGSTFYNPSIVVQATATSIATFPDGTSMVATQTGPRRVGVNLFPLNTAVAYQLFLNSLLWSGGLLN